MNVSVVYHCRRRGPCGVLRFHSDGSWTPQLRPAKALTGLISAVLNGSRARQNPRDQRRLPTRIHRLTQNCRRWWHRQTGDLHWRRRRTGDLCQHRRRTGCHRPSSRRVLVHWTRRRLTSDASNRHLTVMPTTAGRRAAAGPIVARRHASRVYIHRTWHCFFRTNFCQFSWLT